MFSKLAWSQSFNGAYRCSLAIRSISGKGLVDIRDKAVTMNVSHEAGGEGAEKLEVFEGLGQVIREATVSNSEILMSGRWIRLGDVVVPEISLGFYNFNKLAADRRVVVVESRGDARSFVKLTGHAANGTRFEVTCKNERLEQI